MKNLIYLILLTLLSCDATETKDTGMDYTEAAIPKVSFNFKLIGEVDSNKMKRVTRIEVLNKKGNTLHQVLESFESEVQENETAIVEDLNFDGYPDIRILQFLPSTPNIPYFYWLYDADKNKFIRNEAMEKITSPALDVTNQCIISQWSKSRTHVGTDHYQFKGKKLVFQKQEVQEYTDPNTYVLTVRKPIGDSLQVIKRELIKEEDSF